MIRLPSVPAFLRRPATLLGAGCAFLLFSAFLLVSHVRSVQMISDVSLPLVARTPSLERRAQILRNQLELAELNAALQVGSPEERLHVYALPAEVDLDRLILAFDLLRDDLSAQGSLSALSPLALGNREEADDGLARRDVRLEATLRIDGLHAVLAFVRLSGFLTVGDALTPAERMRLLSQTEAENPAGIVALEQFLSADLLTYARESRPYDEQLLRSFASPGFEQTLRSVIQESLLRDARRLLEGSLGAAYEQRNLWPLQYLAVREAELRPGGSPDWYRLTLTLSAYERRKD